MRITSITPVNIAPFLGDSVTIELEPDVTILTGGNDCGKTRLLDLIETFVTRRPYNEKQLANLVHHAHSAGSPDYLQDGSVGARIAIAGTARGASLDPLYAPGALVEAQLVLRMNDTGALLRQVNGSAKRKDEQLPGRWRFKKLTSSRPLSDSLSLKDPQLQQDAFLRMAFGEEGKSLAAMTDGARDLRAGRAEDRISSKLDEILPGSGLRVALRIVQDQVNVTVRDDEGDRTLVSGRGAGLQRFLGLIGQLSAIQSDSDLSPLVLLWDEPEEHLHADLQHYLRLALERLGQLEHVQVVYSTHSPSMINNLRPNRVRALKKVSSHGTTIVRCSTPTRNNWRIVRDGLGLSAADSLLYSDLTIVVEGQTEVLAFPEMLLKLQQHQRPGLQDADELLQGLHLLDGEGCSAEYFVRLAKSQGNHVIVILDGDKKETAEAIRAKHRDVPVVVLEEGTETEDLVVRSRYFASLQELVENPELTLGAYESWAAGRPGDTRMFSKRVEAWLKEVAPGTALYKAEVMIHAVQHANGEDLGPANQPMAELAARIREIRSSMSRPR